MNADGAYLMACANSRPEYIRNNELIGVVRTFFPATPYSKFAARFVGAPETYDMRYASLSVYDLNPPGPVLRTFSDGEIRNFYYNLYGAQLWEEGYQRNVSLVVANSQEALDRCRVDTSESLVLTLEGAGDTELNGEDAGPEWWSFVYRELIPQGQIINETNAAQFGMKPDDIYKTSIHDARKVMCTEEGDSCDRNPYRAASIMKVDICVCSCPSICFPTFPLSLPPLYDVSEGNGKKSMSCSSFLPLPSLLPSVPPALPPLIPFSTGALSPCGVVHLLPFRRTGRC